MITVSPDEVVVASDDGRTVFAFGFTLTLLALEARLEAALPFLV
jgi:hypothetical protein